MAQYQRNFYSSSLYGRLKAFHGDYLTEEFDAQEPFSYHIDAKIQAQLPSTFMQQQAENLQEPMQPNGQYRVLILKQELLIHQWNS